MGQKKETIFGKWVVDVLPFAERFESKLKTGVPDIFYSVGHETDDARFLNMAGWIETKYVSELGSQFDRFQSGLDPHQSIKLIDYTRRGVAAHLLLGVGPLWLLIPGSAECVKNFQIVRAYQDYADQADAQGSITEEGKKEFLASLVTIHEKRIEAALTAIYRARHRADQQRAGGLIP